MQKCDLARDLAQKTVKLLTRTIQTVLFYVSMRKRNLHFCKKTPKSNPPLQLKKDCLPAQNEFRKRQMMTFFVFFQNSKRN